MNRQEKKNKKCEEKKDNILFLEIILMISILSFSIFFLIYLSNNRYIYIYTHTHKTFYYKYIHINRHIKNIIKKKRKKNKHKY